MKPYADWPEWIRWLLFGPAVLLAAAGLTLLLRALNALRGDRGILTEVGIAAFSAWMFFPLVASLAPRAKRLVLWCVYVPTIGYSAFALLFGCLRAIGIAGLLPMLPPPDWVTWTRADTTDLLKSLAWLAVGTLAFRRQLEHASKPSHSQLESS